MTGGIGGVIGKDGIRALTIPSVTFVGFQGPACARGVVLILRGLITAVR